MVDSAFILFFFLPATTYVQIVVVNKSLCTELRRSFPFFINLPPDGVTTGSDYYYRQSDMAINTLEHVVVQTSIRWRYGIFVSFLSLFSRPLTIICSFVLRWWTTQTHLFYFLHIKFTSYWLPFHIIHLTKRGVSDLSTDGIRSALVWRFLTDWNYHISKLPGSPNHLTYAQSKTRSQLTSGPSHLNQIGGPSGFRRRFKQFFITCQITNFVKLFSNFTIFG